MGNDENSASENARGTHASQGTADDESFGAWRSAADSGSNLRIYVSV